MARIVRTDGVEELVKENPGSVLGPVYHDIVVGTRIGVSPVYVEGLRRMRVRRELTRGGMGAEIDRDRLVVFAEQGQNGSPQGPRNVLLGVGRVQKGDDGSDGSRAGHRCAYKGLNAAGPVVGVERFAAVELVKVGRPGAFSLQNGVLGGRQCRLGPRDNGGRRTRVEDLLKQGIHSLLGFDNLY